MRSSDYRGAIEDLRLALDGLTDWCRMAEEVIDREADLEARIEALESALAAAEDEIAQLNGDAP
jgi:phage shock protein A